MSVPRLDHPWRQYANKIKPHNGEIKPSYKPLHLVLSEIVTGWNNTTLPLRYRGQFNNYYLLELPDKIVAIWLISLLRRYVNAKAETEEELDQI